MRKFESLSELQTLIGQEIAVSDWVDIDQKRIDLFAEVTGDHQWVHVDPVRAATGPFGATIAHGFLTLSLLPLLSASAMSIGDVKMGVNYGLNKVRFPSPVKVGSRLRGRISLVAMEPLPPMGALRGYQLTLSVIMECEGADKPACIAESVSRRYH
jgi:acyl dehydratase